MSSGGGNSFFESLLDVGLQVGTSGIVGYKSDDGGLGAGIIGQPIVDVTKEVTGASAAEEANKQARERFEQEKADTLTARAEVKAQTAADQLAASRGAAGARAGRTSTGTTSRASNLGGDERDFLGL